MYSTRFLKKEDLLERSRLYKSIQKMFNDILLKNLSSLNPYTVEIYIDDIRDNDYHGIIFDLKFFLESMAIIPDESQNATMVIQNYYEKKDDIFQEIGKQLYHLSPEETQKFGIDPDDYEITIVQIYEQLEVYTYTYKHGIENDSNSIGNLNIQVLVQILMTIQRV